MRCPNSYRSGTLHVHILPLAIIVALCTVETSGGTPQTWLRHFWHRCLENNYVTLLIYHYWVGGASLLITANMWDTSVLKPMFSVWKQRFSVYLTFKNTQWFVISHWNESNFMSLMTKWITNPQIPSHVMRSHVPTPCQVTRSYVLTPSQVTRSYVLTPSQVTRSYVLTPSQVTRSYVLIPSQVTRSYVPTPRQVTRSHVPTPRQVTRSHVPTPRQVTRSHVPTPRQVTRSHAPTPRQVTRSHAPTPRQVTNVSHRHPPNTECDLPSQKHIYIYSKQSVKSNHYIWYPLYIYHYCRLLHDL